MVEKHEEKRYMLTPTIETHYRENYRRLAKRMSFRAGTPEDGEDVVQEAYLRAIKYQASFNGTDFNRWFTTILNNALREQKNNQKGYSTQEDETNEEESIACNFYPAKVMLEISERIEKRPEDQAEILSLFFYQEYTAVDISRVLPLSYAQVHQVIHRFRKELKGIYGRLPLNEHTIR